MKFIDSIKDEGVNPFVEMNKEGALLKRCDELIAGFDKAFENASTYMNIDYFQRKGVKGYPKMPEFWANLKSESVHEHLEFLIYACWEYLYFCLDVVTTYRYLVQANTDWEYRYFARIFYKLMHESQQIRDHRGKWINDVRNDLPYYNFEEFNKALKALNKYINKYDSSDFVDVRDKIEAHRDQSIHDQIQLHYHLSVKRSSEIIQEGFDLVVKYQECLIALMDEAFFSAYEIRYERIVDENGNVQFKRM